jgi:hypothetical protein
VVLPVGRHRHPPVRPDADWTKLITQINLKSSISIFYINWIILIYSIIIIKNLFLFELNW